MFNHCPNGFHMTFENGYTISVQWGPGNYCDNRSAHYGEAKSVSKTAEVAVWNSADEWVKLGDNDDVLGWVTTDRVLEIMNAVRNLQSPDIKTLEGI